LEVTLTPTLEALLDQGLFLGLFLFCQGFGTVDDLLSGLPLFL